ncbi:MAG: sugar-transfer associated ATP-grasp domain-containing protein [Oscillospiraceae bacterium]
MLKKLRRKVYRKIRFQTWYRKAYYYHRKRRDLDKTIAQYRGVDVLSDKKRLYRLRRDMIRSLFRYGSYYNEYFLFGYEGKDADYRDSFITEGVRMSYYPRMNDPKNTNLLENKYLTYQKFRDFYGRDVLRIKKGAQPTPAALEALRNFTQAHPDYIVKPIYAAFGKGVHTESIRDYPYLEAAHAAYSAHGAILEQIIEQGEALSRIHPQSVNTLRIPTVVLADGEVRLFHPTLRVGRGDGIIDNFSAGGISALIDPETGCICSDGADKKGRRYAAHPDTGVRFNGYRLPEWDKAVAMVTTAAHMVPGNHYCGWDLASQHTRLVHGRGQLHRADGRHADHHTNRQKGRTGSAHRADVTPLL